MIRLHNQMNVGFRHAEEEGELQDRRKSAGTAGLDSQPDEASDDELAALERHRLPLDFVQLKRNCGRSSVTDVYVDRRTR